MASTGSMSRSQNVNQSTSALFFFCKFLSSFQLHHLLRIAQAALQSWMSVFTRSLVLASFCLKGCPVWHAALPASVGEADVLEGGIDVHDA